MDLNYRLLQELCSVFAPSGEEEQMTAFLLKYIEKNKSSWKVQPEIYSGEGFQNNIVLVFGKPRTAIFAHIDSIGFTARYKNQLIKIGGPVLENGTKLVGKDKNGVIEGILEIAEKNISLNFERTIERGTNLVFKSVFFEDNASVQCAYMDNRLGVFNALKVAETIENGMVVFSTWEEHGGGSVGYLAKFMYEKYKVSQALISDITWVTEGVKDGKGVAISMRDSGLPRRVYVNKILALADESKVPYQIEVEGSGGSDGNELQSSPYPIDWCFIGAPEQNVHSAQEKVYKSDIQSMIEMYQYLMDKL